VQKCKTQWLNKQTAHKVREEFD